MILVFGVFLVWFSLESSPFVDFKPLRTQLSKMIPNFSNMNVLNTVVAIFKKDIILEQPNESLELLDGRLVDNQWKGIQGKFVIATVDKIQVYNSPSEEAEKVRLLNMSERVRIVYRDDQLVERGHKKGVWVFLKNERGTEDIGWALDFDLGYKDRFVSMKKWVIDQFLYERGEVITTLKTTLKGDFIADWFAKGDGIKLKGVHEGDILRFQNVAVIIRNDYMGWYDFFYFEKMNEFLPEWKYRKSYFKKELIK